MSELKGRRPVPATAGRPVGLKGVVIGRSQTCRLVRGLLRGVGVPVLSRSSRQTSESSSLSTLRDLEEAVANEEVNIVVVSHFDDDVSRNELGRILANHLTWPSVIIELNEGTVSYSIMTPDDREASSDIFTAAASGAIYACSDPGQPRPTEVPVSDFSTALTVVLGALACLNDVNTPVSNVIASPIESSALLTVDVLNQAVNSGDNMSRTSRHPWAQLYIAQAACGSGITVHVSSSQAFWVRLANVLGREDLIEVPRFATYHDRVENYFELAKIVQMELAKRTADEWTELLVEADVPHAPLLTPLQAVQHPQADALALAARDCLPAVKSLLRPIRFNGKRPVLPTGV
jgi:hypothetical protein